MLGWFRPPPKKLSYFLKYPWTLDIAVSNSRESKTKTLAISISKKWSKVESERSNADKSHLRLTARFIAGEQRELRWQPEQSARLRKNLSTHSFISAQVENLPGVRLPFKEHNGKTYKLIHRWRWIEMLNEDWAHRAQQRNEKKLFNPRLLRSCETKKECLKSARWNKAKQIHQNSNWSKQLR